jgi:excisionase family DNA binding protein
MPPTPSSLLTVAQVAGRLAVSKRTVERLLQSGELKRIKVRATTRVDAGDVERYLAKQRGEQPQTEQQITGGQLSALHAKAAERDRTLGLAKGTTKVDALAWASRELAREIASANDLSRAEASALLDWLEATRELATL